MVLKIAFDWSPNIFHAGLFMAKHERLYDKDSDAHCEFLIPISGHVQHTAPRLLELYEADIGIMSADDVIYYHTQADKPKLVALANLVQHREDIVALCTWKNMIKKPGDLDGKKLAAWGGHYEVELTRLMATRDGGTGDFKVVRPNGPEAWNTFCKHEADAVWIYTNCEGVEAELSGKINQMNIFKPNMPLINSPVLVCREDVFQSKHAQISKFLAATAKGYERVVEMEPTRFAEVFCSVAKVTTPKEILAEQLTRTRDLFLGAERRWGVLNNKSWENLINWMDKDAHILKDESGHRIAAGRVGSGFIIQGPMLA